MSLKEVINFKAISGFGVIGTIKGVTYFLGNKKLIHQNNIPCANKRELIENLEMQGKTIMILANKDKILGIICVADTIRDDAKKSIETLHKLGLKTYLITGDNEKTALAIAKQCAIKNVFAEVLPQDKAHYVKQLQKTSKVIMVGDGINDAPALAQADIGIAMGSANDIAIETGNIILLKNDLSCIVKAIKLSKMTINKIKQNMFWALIYNVVGIPIAAGVFYFSTGLLLNPIVAGAVMALSSVSVVMNSILLKHKKLD